MDAPWRLCCNRFMPARSNTTGLVARRRRRAAPTTAAPAFSPLYRQIKELLTRSLTLAEWKPGEALPSEPELAQRFKVSQGTVRKALDALAADGPAGAPTGQGHLRRHARRAAGAVPIPAPDARPGPAQRDAAPLPGLPRLRAPAEIARALGLGSGDSVLHLRRLLLAEDMPVVLDDIWLPARLFKGLTAERLTAYQRADVQPVRGRVRRADDPRRGKDPGRRCRRSRGRPAATWPRARRCCSWSGVHSPMPTAPWNCAAACTAPTRTTIAMS